MPWGFDYPDWGGHYNTGQFYPLYDMAELAARLGSGMTYDRRGALIWYDDFRHGVGGWETTEGTAQRALNLSADYWERPPFSADLLLDVASTNVVAMKRNVEVPQLTMVGGQISVRFVDDSGYVELYWSQYSGTINYLVGLRADPRAETIELYSEGGWTPLRENTGDFRDAACFFHLKLVLDMETHEAVRAIALGEEFDLSGEKAAAEGSNEPPMLTVWVQHVTDGAASGHVYVDNVIITAAEPAN